MKYSDWELFHGMQLEDLGLLPEFLNEAAPEGAVDQINANYGHGGGWHDFPGFKLSADRTKIFYPGDPPMEMLARTKFRDEEIILFNGSWVAVVQPDGTYRISRVD